jgi:hypothetical protein
VPAAALLALHLLAMNAVVEAQEPVQAVWQERKVAFSYRSAIAIYSCDSLRRRVASLLLAVGARPDLEVVVSNCSPTAFPQDATTGTRTDWTQESRSGTAYDRRFDDLQVMDVRVRLSMPAEMTPEVVARLKRDKSRRELVSRATGNPLPRFDDPIPFQAQRQRVVLSHQTVGLDPVECELLEQVERSVFRRLDVQVVRRGYSCDPYKVSRIPPVLEVETLAAVQPGTGTEEKPPPAEAEDAPAAAPESPDPPPGSDEAAVEPPAEVIESGADATGRAVQGSRSARA